MRTKQSIDKLRLSRYKLRVLLDITTSINKNRSANFLLTHFVHVLNKELEIKNVVIFLIDNDKWKFASQSTLKRKDVKISAKKDLLKYKKISGLVNDSKLNNFDFIIPVCHKKNPLAFFLISDDNDKIGNSNIIKHLNFIKTLANIIVVSIENKRLFKRTINQEVLKKQLEIAADIQQKLVPNKERFPKNNFFKIDSFYKPHFDIGGDYFDVIKLNKFEYGFCIADVSGKGISAALLMSNFQATLRAIFTDKICLRNLLIRLNKHVFDLNDGDRFITIFLAKYNTKTKKLTYINAAHTTSVLYNKENIETTHLTSSSVGLGMLKQIPEIKIKSIKINSPSRLVCYTDGLSELENKNGKSFGISEIEKILKKDYPLDKFIPNLNETMLKFKGKNNFFDDVSILCIDLY